MAEIRNYTMNFGVRRLVTQAPLGLTCSRKSANSATSRIAFARGVLWAIEDLPGPEPHG
jgi:hypothetical protein